MPGGPDGQVASRLGGVDTGTLIARDVVKAHGDETVLGGVSVTVAPGDVLGVVGPNGAGKSTLLRILAGVDAPDRGRSRSPPGRPATCRRSPTARPARRSRPTSPAAPAWPRPPRGWMRPRPGWPRARTAPTRPTRTRSRSGSGSAAPTSSRAPRRCAASSASTRRCSPARPPRSPAARPRAPRSPRSCCRASACCCSTSRRTTSTSTGSTRLERFVANRPGGAVIVSHDRAFLERTVTRVLELDEVAHTAAEYGGGWAGYLELRATAARHAEERYQGYTTERDRLIGPRPAPAAVVGDGCAEGAPEHRRRAGQERAPPSHRALREAGGEGQGDGEGDRAARRGRQAVAPLGAAAALRRRRAGRRDHRPARAGRDAPRRLHARPARPRARVGRAGRARRPERQRQDDARRGPARAARARGGHALGRARRPDRRARPGAPRLLRRGHAPGRLRRAQRALRPGVALAAGEVRPRRGGRPAHGDDALTG